MRIEYLCIIKDKSVHIEYFYTENFADGSRHPTNSTPHRFQRDEEFNIQLLTVFFPIAN